MRGELQGVSRKVLVGPEINGGGGDLKLSPERYWVCGGRGGGSEIHGRRRELYYTLLWAVIRAIMVRDKVTRWYP